MLIRRIQNRLITNSRNAIRFGKFQFRESGPKVAERRTVFFDIVEPGLERYLYWLVKMFDIAEWGVAMRVRPWLLLNLRNCSEFIYDIEALELKLRPHRGADLFITDSIGVDGAIYVDTNYFAKDKSDRSFNLPFFMHPDIYHTGLHRTLPDLSRQGVRNIRVFLGGNLTSEGYRSGHMGDRFGLLNRNEVALISITGMRSAGEYSEILRPEDAVPLLSGERACLSVAMRNAILPTVDWMRLLSRSDFFIAPPGVLMPFSHNIIESMAVGTIPITEYGHLFDPPLVHGETCLSFKGENELIERIHEVSVIPQIEIDRMRQNVIAYYDQHLEPRSVVKKLYDRRDDLDRIYLIAGHLSVGKN